MPITLESLLCHECGEPASKHLCIQSQQSILLHHLNAAREDLQKICELQGMVKNVKHNSAAICGNLRIETITILEKYYIPEAPDA